MRTLNGLIPRNLALRKARTTLTLLGIALGVAAMVAAGVLSESATRSMADMFDQAAGRADLAVTNALEGIAGSEGFDAAAFEQVRGANGVEAAAPLLQVASLPVSELDDWEYSFIFGSFSGAVVFGVDPQASRAMGHYRLTAGSDLDATSGDDLLLSENYAQELGLGPGDVLEMVAPTGTVRLVVTGLLASDGLVQLNLGQVAVTRLETARRLFDRPGRLDQIDVVTASGTTTAHLQAQLEALLGEGFSVFRPASKGALVNQMIQTITLSLGFIAMQSLLVGGFLIYNTFAMTVAERTRELGLLRALGTGRGQTSRLVLVEATLLGLIGAGLGIALGLAMASGMRQVVGAAVNSELTQLAILPQHIITGFLIGLLVALVAALPPALRAGRLPVVEAIQARRAEGEREYQWQLVAGAVLASLGLLATIGYMLHPIDVAFELAFLVLMASLVGVGLLIPAMIPPLERWCGTILGFFGIEGWLGGRNLARRPGRTALTAGALMFGLASVIVVGGVVSSTTGFVLEYLDRTLAAELWLYAPQRLPRHLAEELETLPEVRLARPAAMIPTRLIPSNSAQPEIALTFGAIDPERSKHLDFYFASDGGDQDEALARLTDGGAVLISTALRAWYDLHVGDTIRLQSLQGPVDFDVVGVTLNPNNNGYTVTGVWDDAIRYFDTDRADIFAINLAPGIDPVAARQRILELWGETYNLRIETLSEFRVRSEKVAQDFNALSNASVLVGVVVAALGVTNTLLMNVLERRREIGMLRSLGMTRGQIVRLVLSESAAMGALGGVLGVVLGAWFSRFALTSSVSVTGLAIPYVFPLEAVLSCMVIALMVPILAGLWPAWHGARVNVVKAMRSE